MCDIYSKSYLTIAASRAPNPIPGFLFPRDEWQVGYHLQDIPGTMVRSQMHSRVDEENPLNLRAWTLQEMVLSGRVLSYATKDTAWRCLTETTCECGSGGFDSSGADNMVGNSIGPIPVEDDGNSKDDGSSEDDGNSEDDGSSEIDSRSRLPHYWRKLVGKYTSRSITKDSDRLPALSGIAEKFKSNKRGRYLAGIWENDLPYALAWSTYEGKMPETYIAPSWSWASVTGEATYETWLRSSKEYPETVDYPSQWCQLVECGTTPVWNDTAEVTEGYLKVYGQIIMAELEMTSSSPPEYNLNWSRKWGGPRDEIDEVEGEISIDTPLRYFTYSTDSANSKIPTMKTFCRSSTPSVEATEDSLPPGGSSFGNVMLLLIKPQKTGKRRLNAYYLILVPSTKVENAYERIGLFSGFLPGGSWAWAEIWSKEERVEEVSTNREERLSYFKEKLSPDNFEWCRFLPHWRNITII